MDFEPLKQFHQEATDESVSIREMLEKYSIYLKWFILSVVIFLILAFLKVYYETPQYNISASILIKDKDNGDSFADLSDFADMGLFGNSKNSLENEIEILKSRRLITKVVEELKLNISYFIEDSPIDREMFPNFPVVLHFTTDSLNTDHLGGQLKLIIKSADKFEFFDVNESSVGIKSFKESFKVNFGEADQPDFRTISISKNENYSGLVPETVVKIKLRPVNAIASGYMAKILIEPIDLRFSKVLKISLDESVIAKGQAIINNLIEQYNADGINDKDLISKATTDFLDDRLVLISNEIEAIESSAAQFKSSRGMIDAGGAGAGVYLQSSSVAESEMVNANTQLQLVNYMLSELNRKSAGELLPGNIGLSDPSIVGMINSYNELVLQRNRVLRSSSDMNPIIISIDSQLGVLKNNLAGSLNALKSSAQIQIDAVSRKSGSISSKIASAPKYEQEFKGIVRDQETKNALYLFLLQKREESILSNAVKIDKAKIIDHAFSPGRKVSPKPIRNYLGAIFLGLLLPFLIIYAKNLLDTKVHDEKDLKKLGLPYLGDIPYKTSQKNLYIQESDNSNIAEAFRYIRTNINFMLDSKELGKTVYVTSTQSGEGKTFSAINLANSLAISGKKTLLLAMDLRAPKVVKYLGIEKAKKGVTNFIKDPSLVLNDIINKETNFENLHIIHSGDIPPNPVELLMSKRVKELFNEVKLMYEYIIVDTAPVGMVTDTIQISNFADLTIYVIKANFLDKRMLHIPSKLDKEKKLPNMAVLINGSDHIKGAYGYGYGYGNKKKDPWFKKVFKSAAF